MSFTMKASVPCRVCKESGCPLCELGWVVVSNHQYESQEGLAIATAQFILNALPPSRSPLDTSVAHRVNTWDGEGKLTFPLANRTRVVLTKDSP
jgi:hypothetical protein